MNQPAVGFIGVGVMGSSMAGHLLAAGHPVFVFNRTRARAEQLLAKGATWCETPAEVARRAPFVITMVGTPDDVRSVYLGEAGISTQAQSGATLIDMTTSDPELAAELAKTFAARSIEVLDAPVSGGDIGARNATLSIMVGGEKAAVDRAMPYFQVMGKTIVQQGPAGSGQHAKLCNQIVVAGTMIGVCESLVYAKRSGLDAETVLNSIRGGAAGCWTLENLAPRILKGNFDPGFMVDHFVKDMGIALDEAKRMNLKLEGLEVVRRLYQKTQAMGHGRKGTHALFLALDQM